MGNSLVEDYDDDGCSGEGAGLSGWTKHVRARRDLWVSQHHKAPNQRSGSQCYITSERAKLWEIDDIACFGTMKR